MFQKRFVLATWQWKAWQPQSASLKSHQKHLCNDLWPTSQLHELEHSAQSLRLQTYQEVANLPSCDATAPKNRTRDKCRLQAGACEGSSGCGVCPTPTQPWTLHNSLQRPPLTGMDIGQTSGVGVLFLGPAFPFSKTRQGCILCLFCRQRSFHGFLVPWRHHLHFSPPQHYIISASHHPSFAQSQRHIQRRFEVVWKHAYHIISRSKVATGVLHVQRTGAGNSTFLRNTCPIHHAITLHLQVEHAKNIQDTDPQIPAWSWYKLVNIVFFAGVQADLAEPCAASARISAWCCGVEDIKRKRCQRKRMTGWRGAKWKRCQDKEMPTERYAKGKGCQERVGEREVKRKRCQRKEVSGERDVRETDFKRTNVKEKRRQEEEMPRERDVKRQRDARGKSWREEEMPRDKR